MSVANQTLALSSDTRILDISSNPDMFVYLNLETQDLIFLTHLNVSSCELTDSANNSFLSMKSLKVLVLSFNKIRHFKAYMFVNQAKLEILVLRGNLEPLIFESKAFVGLVSIRSLDLSKLQIERIAKGSFATLHLNELRISHSHIYEIEKNSLDELYVEKIFLNSTTIDTFAESMFHGGTDIHMFVTDDYKYCCVRPLSVQEENCHPQHDDASSCNDLFKHKILMPLIVVVGLFALCSNVISVIYRLKHHAEQLKLCYGIAVLHLACSDSLLGCYLIMIGAVGNMFRGEYIFNDETWRSSVWCQLAGILSTVSCEASLLFSCLITFDRLLVVKYPFGQKRLTKRNGSIIAIVFWSIALFLAILPLTVPSLFKGNFYSRSSLCLALPLNRKRSSGWGYAFGVFIVFNSLACLLLAIGQWTIYREVQLSKKAVRDRRSKSSNDLRITRNLVLVVTTNFLCWLPVGFLGKHDHLPYPCL
ncbi:MAG: 7 transmembrane receptor [Candidatus Thiodiazotropha taylori]